MNPPKTQWRKSIRSAEESACVETAAVDGTIAVRDSKNPTGAHLAFTPTIWAAFLTEVKIGTHDG
jgi:hypothetical protein